MEQRDDDGDGQSRRDDAVSALLFQAPNGGRMAIPLDAVTRRGLQDQLLDLPQRPATLFVSHDVDEALYLADRVVLLRPGQPLLELAPDLPWPRDQVRTPALPAFQRARAALMAMLEESS